jgi:hypothetical protein
VVRAPLVASTGTVDPYWHFVHRVSWLLQLYLHGLFSRPFSALTYRCWNPSLRHRHRASIRLVGYYGYSDTRAFVTENLPTSYSRVDHIVEYINHVNTMLILHRLATRPIKLPSCIRSLIIEKLDAETRSYQFSGLASFGTQDLPQGSQASFIAVSSSCRTLL